MTTEQTPSAKEDSRVFVVVCQTSSFLSLL